jgi:Interferon-induced transmembrane protein
VEEEHRGFSWLPYFGVQRRDARQAARNTAVFPHRENDTLNNINHQRHQQHYPESNENPMDANRCPDNHECYAFVALLLFAPIGLLACFHALQVNRKWNAGRYSDALHHARQAPRYAGLSVFCGGLLWIYILTIREETRVVDWKWPDWKFD